MPWHDRAMSSWTEVAEKVHTRRFDPVDVTVTAVLGGEGVLVVDTRCSLQEGRELKAELAALTPLPVRWVANTHTHFDHMWGNAEFDTPRQVPPAEFWGHENLPDFDPDDPDFLELREYLVSQGPEWKAKMDELVVRKPDRLVSDFHELDLGGRTAELRHLGRGHTDTDIVVWLPEAGVLIGGDMIEQSAPPAYGPDSFPLDWAPTLDRLVELTGDGTAFVPGHGDAVDHAFVLAQREYVLAVEQQIRELHQSGVPGDQALEAGDWPDAKRSRFADAVKRGYAQLSGEVS